MSATTVILGSKSQIAFLRGWRLDRDICKRLVPCSVSSLTVTGVGVDKLVALLLHLRYKELVTIKRVIVVLLCIWLFSTAFGSLWLWRYQPIKTISISIITLCLLIGTYSYVKIYRIEDKGPMRQRFATSRQT